MDEIEDLSALARRSSLSEAQAQHFQALLATSPEERFWHLAGTELDAEEARTSADELAAARVVARLLAEKPLAQKKRVAARRSVVWLAAAACLLVAISAAALIGLRVQRAREREREQEPARPPSSPAQPVAVRPSGAPAPQPPPFIAPSASEPLDGAPQPMASAESPAPAPTPLSAAELLSAAGRARRAGHSSQAMALLESLQSRFPSSAEAATSDITLGSLKLHSGAAAAALQHFDRYLKRSPQGSLVPEAMWGRAQALAALGNRTEAAKGFSALVQRFPSSTYASSAAAKLRALEPPSPVK